jgi:hypothetical protein
VSCPLDVATSGHIPLTLNGDASFVLTAKSRNQKALP